MEYKPNGWSLRHVHTVDARYIVGCTTRQCGKTETLARELDRALRAKDRFGNPASVGFMAVDFRRANIALDRLRASWHRLYGDGFYNQNLKDHVLTVPEYGGATLNWFSAEDPDAAAGFTMSHWFLDESQWIPDDAWGILRPTMNALEARVQAYGTPDINDNQTWFRGMWLRGQSEDAVDDGYYSFTVSCFENPHISSEEIENARRTETEERFRRLYLGQWVKVGGSVFEKDDLDAIFTGNLEAEPNQDEIDAGNHGPFTMGVDVGQVNDYTVAYVLDIARNAVVARYRVNHLRYPRVGEALARIGRLWHVQSIRIDATGVGRGLYDELLEYDLPMDPFIFTNNSKGELMANLMRMTEHHQLLLPVEDVQLRQEMNEILRKSTPGGKPKFEAPANFFDDSVMALGLVAMDAGGGSSPITVESYATWGGSTDPFILRHGRRTS